MLRLTLMAVALVATGCSTDEPTSEDRLADQVEDTVRDIGPIDIETDGMAISSELDGDELESILTTDGQIELGLTDRVLFSRLSKETQAEVATEMREASEEQDGFGGRIARAVTDAVAQGIGTAVQVPLDDVRDIRVDDGRLVIEMIDGDPSPFEGVKTDNVPIFERISPTDAQRLADAFESARG